MNEIERFNNFISILQEKTPNLKVAYKDESTLMKIISKILFFNKLFMTHYITTIGHTIYFPNREHVEDDPIGAMLTAAHEYEHIRYSEKLGQIPYASLYLLPQILVLLAIPAAFFIGWFSLLFLLLLLPIPAYGRMRIELRGYIMTLFAEYCYREQFAPLDKKALESYAIYINNNFTGPAYYFMWPFGVKKKLDKAIDSILSGDILDTEDIYSQVKEALGKSRDTLI